MVQPDYGEKPREPLRPLGLPLLAIVGLVLVTIPLSLAAAGDGVLPGDVRIQRFVQRAPEPLFRWLADFGNWAGSAPICGLVGIIAFVILLVNRHPVEALTILLAYAARAQNAFIKSIFESPRPTADLVRIDEIAGGLGFPSGHAMGVTLCFGSIALVVGRIMPAGRWRRMIQLGCVLIILSVGFGRIFVGAHWPSDVLGGYLYGVLLLVAIDAFMTWLRRRYLPRTSV